MAKLTDATVVTVEGRENIRGWLRSSVKFTMRIRDGALSDQLLSKIARIKIPANAGTPDLVICSGGKSVFAAKALSVKHSAPLVFVGERKHFPSEWFHTVVSPVTSDNAANVVGVEIIPTGITPELISLRGKPESGVWCMIIGGASRSHLFKEDDWRAIAEGMNALAKRLNIRWLFTTSRRTGAEAEGFMKAALDPQILVDAIWWSEKQRRELHDFIARSELLCVTQDSVTMVSEAVCSGRPVVALAPQDVRFPTDSFLPDYFERLAANKRLKRLAVTDLGTADIAPRNFKVLKKDILPGVARELMQRLGW